MPEKSCSICKEVKDYNCFYTNKATKSGRQSSCKECNLKAYHENKHRYADRIKAYQEQVKQDGSRSEYNAKWYRDNIEKATETRKDWYQRNKGHKNSLTAKRRAQALNATPKWADQWFIDEIYDLAKLRTEMTGINWHVDHIIPLQGKLVCGLHVETNLQVIPGYENYKKNNKFTV